MTTCQELILWKSQLPFVSMNSIIIPIILTIIIIPIIITIIIIPKSTQSSIIQLNITIFFNFFKHHHYHVSLWTSDPSYRTMNITTSLSFTHHHLIIMYNHHLIILYTSPPHYSVHITTFSLLSCTHHHLIILHTSSSHCDVHITTLSSIHHHHIILWYHHHIIP